MRSTKHADSIDIQRMILHTLRAWLITVIYIAAILTACFVMKVAG